MVEISCFYIEFYCNPVIFVFIRYEKFMKIILNGMKIIISIENLKKYEMLFQFYVLSLLCTEDTSKICCVNNDYGISTKQYRKNNFIYRDYDFIYRDYDFIKLDKDLLKKSFVSQEPNEETGYEKLNKFLKTICYYYNNRLISHPLYLIDLFQKLSIDDTHINKVIQYENKIYLLCCIRGFNRDVYSNIKKFI